MYSEQPVIVSDAARASLGREGHSPYDAFLPYRAAFPSGGYSQPADSAHVQHLRDVQFYESGSPSYQSYPGYEHLHHHHNHHSHYQKHHQHSHHHQQSYATHNESSALARYKSQNSFLSTSDHGSHLGTSYGLGMAHLADTVASHLGTVGDCARGPRLTYGHYGLRLPPLVATRQGELLERTGLFEEVPRAQVKPGDYCYRHWSSRVIREHGGVDKGDAFIVSAVGRQGELYGANDHHFVVPGDGGRYRDTKFLRPTAEFFRRYVAYA